jgi:hypothetical protein
MLNLLISTVLFFIAAWSLNRYLDDQGLPKGMTRGMLVFTLAAMVAWGGGTFADWAQIKIAGPQATLQKSGEITQLLRAAGELHQ